VEKFSKSVEAPASEFAVLFGYRSIVTLRLG